MNSNDITSQQIEYYRARADEYDEWHLRLGRYDRGPNHKEQWFHELGVVSNALDICRPFGRTLELACGTGLWTAQLAEGASSLTAVDAARETILINQSRNSNYQIEYIEADIFNWKPTTQYDFIFFGFWLSHIPANRMRDFWDMLARALTQNGRVFFVDSQRVQSSTATDHAPISNSGIVERKLNDGRRFHIVKLFYKPKELSTQLHRLNWNPDVKTTQKFFIYGTATKQQL